MIPRSRSVLVVGAGPADLAVSRELRRLRVDHLVLDGLLAMIRDGRR